MVGDEKQLAPHVFTPKRESAYRRELMCTMFVRLIKSGFPVGHLYHQGRMVPDIAGMVSALYYQNLLTSSPKTWPSNRPYAREFGNWAKKKWRLTQGRNVVVVDHVKGPYNETQITSGGSKYNQLYSLTTSQLLQDLLKIKARLPGTADPTISVLAAYSAQRDRCINMKASMELDKLDGVDQLTVATIDAVQGKEFDYVILILSILRGPGFLQDPRRMNVGNKVSSQKWSYRHHLAL